jgi:hypothetical protein
VSATNEAAPGDTPGPGEAGTATPTASQGASSDPPTDERERGEDGRLLSRETATYRRRLREVESERDSLRAQLDALQTQEVERLAGAAGLQVASDVWTFGATLDTLRNDAGAIDSDTVTTMVSDILK